MANPAVAHAHAAAAHDGADHGSHVKIYLRVFASLAVLTAIEYFYAQIFANAFQALVLGLMTWALIKAALVGLYFMHVKWEGRWIYAMLVPAGVLAVFLVVMLYPDIALHSTSDDVMAAELQHDDEGEGTLPLTESPAVGRPASEGTAGAAPAKAPGH